MLRKAPLIRKAELRARTAPKPWRRKPDDKVSEADYNYVAARDLAVGGCVLAHLVPSHTCHDIYGNQIRPDGVFEIDHVDNGGTGKRGASERWNLVRLCPLGHRFKTENARLVRPMLREYLERVQPRDAA